MPRPPQIPKRNLPTPAKKLAPQQVSVNVLIHQGFGLQQQGKLKEARAIYERILKIQPNHFDALQLLGGILVVNKDYQAALELLSKAISFRPDFAEAHYNQGAALKGLNRLDETLASYDRAIAIDPSLAQAHYNRANTLQELQRFEEAITSFNTAIAKKPDYFEAFNNKGVCLKALSKLDEALLCFDAATSLFPDYAEAHYNRGSALQDLQRFEEAISSLKKALTIRPDYDFLLGDIQHAKMCLSDWSDFEAQQEKIMQKVHAGGKVSSPFPIIALADAPSVHRLCSETYIKEKFPLNMALVSIPKRTKKERIRIGYFSADFGDHPVSFLTAELFETHNKNKFELIAFSFGPNKPSQMRDRLVNAFDQFIDVSKLSDQAVAELARKLEIDIAIDLGGFTGSCRMGIFAFRAAPIQASYIGYLGTLGASYYDYLIADKTIVPTHLKEHYSEKIMHLPSYQVNDSKRQISNRVFSREELGLPPTGFVFCCFNNNYKILPHTFDSWVKILKAVDSSVLMLVANDPLVQSNLKKEATLRGMDPNRLVFGKRIPREDYLARYKSCDLFLDTYPYNAGTTASDALWSGLPVLTLMGQSFASRVAASLLQAIDLPELITSNAPEYESMAIELATNPHKLNEIKQKLAAQRLSTPLFNTPLFTQYLESAYTQAIERYWADLPPDYIDVQTESIDSR